MKQTPSRKEKPNWKIEPLLEYTNEVSKVAWELGIHITCDKQTIGFQGKHKDKKKIAYKREGDGFQCDAVGEDGYTYSFYFRNEPPPIKYKK